MTPILLIKIVAVLGAISFVFGLVSESKRQKKNNSINYNHNKKEISEIDESEISVSDIKIICK